MEFYKNTANDFSRTRYKIWHGVKTFLNSIPTNSIILDAGCGNGKNMMETEHKFIAYDSCYELIELAKSKVIENNKTNIINFILGDVQKLPFESDSFDAVMSIAVIHHISNEIERFTAFKEMIRVCKPKGSILITVWKAESNPVFDSGIVQRFPLTKVEEITSERSKDHSSVITSNTSERSKDHSSVLAEVLNDNIISESTDRLIKWKSPDGIKYRFYHFFSLEEINDICFRLKKLYSIDIIINDELNNYYIWIKKH